MIQINGNNRFLGREVHSAVFADDDRSDDGRPELTSTSAPLSATSPIHNLRGGPRRVSADDSDRSDSPPNSVDAFADHRPRPRAGTAGTLASIEPNTLHPSPSGDGFTRPRALSADRSTIRTADRSDQGSVEDDVCFPQQDEPSQIFSINFEELDEFVATQKHASDNIPAALRRRQSVSCRSGMANLGRAAATRTNPLSPQILAQMIAPRKESVAEGSVDEIANEKAQAQFAAEAASDDSHADARKEPLHRWSFFSSVFEESIHAADLGDLLMPGETFKSLFELPADGGCWWLDMLMPTEDEVEVICKAFGIHGLTREDIIQQETREKVELFKSYYFVCFRSFFQMDKSHKDYLEPVNVYAVVFREGILTFTFASSPHASNVRKRMGRLRDYIALGADWICYALIDDIVDSFGPAINRVERQTDGIEESVFTARSEDSRHLLREISESRQSVMSLQRLLGGKADVIKGFAKRCNEAYSMAPRSDVGLYLSDIQDHVVTMMGNLGHADHVLSRSHANYLAQISAESIVQGTKVNEVLSKITFLASILVPLNLVCGLFGMNVEVPGKNATGLGWFFGIVGLLAVFVVLSTIFARWKRLI